MSVSTDRVAFSSPDIYLYDSTLSAWIKAGSCKSFEANIETETEAYQGSYVMAIDAAIKSVKCTGKISQFAPDLTFAQKVLGGTLTSAATQTISESKTIDAQAHTVTLSQTPTANGVQRVTNSTGAVLQEVVSNPAQGVSYTRATTTLTFHVSETGAVQCTYGYSLNSGQKLTLAITAAPGVATRYKLMATTFVCADGSVSGGQATGKAFRFVVNSAVVSGGLGVKMGQSAFAEGGDYTFQALMDGTNAPVEASWA